MSDGLVCGTALRRQLWRQPRWVASELVSLGAQATGYALRVAAVGVPLGLAWLGLLACLVDGPGLLAGLRTLGAALEAPGGAEALRAALLRWLGWLWVVEVLLGLVVWRPRSVIEAEVARCTRQQPSGSGH